MGWINPPAYAGGYVFFRRLTPAATHSPPAYAGGYPTNP